ncbi:hypothetical protein BT96DRAFT_975431 [Gymnopus androsaceus JB14]|uniref:Transmembrane protein n=1 Tax=Gymnopus androsaceus JB14 TaxID=1447944 RepID=A0A6A4HQE7_9AGAR|nr:hypothetical protein BT96DRAFT_975431 [Gymnopus androsaceus JB14]
MSTTTTGTFVRAVIAVEDPSNAAGWNCTVDNHLINSSLITFNGLVTGIVACDSGLTLAGMFDEHTLEMNFEFSESTEGANDATSTIWLDSIQYQPLLSDPLDGVMLRVHNSDPFVTYNNNTGTWLGGQYLEETPGVYEEWNATSNLNGAASLNFAFTGSSVALYGVNFVSCNSNNASYTVDGGPVDHFTLPSSTSIISNASSLSTVLNWPLLNLSLSDGQHNLNISTAANVSVNPQPLSIVYFIIKTNSSSVHSITSPTTSSPPSSVSSAPRSFRAKSEVIGIVSGVVTVILLSCIWVVYRKRIRAKSRSGMVTVPILSPGDSADTSNQLFPRTDSQGIGVSEESEEARSGKESGAHLPQARYTDSMEEIPWSLRGPLSSSASLAPTNESEPIPHPAAVSLRTDDNVIRPPLNTNIGPGSSSLFQGSRKFAVNNSTFNSAARDIHLHYHSYPEDKNNASRGT